MFSSAGDKEIEVASRRLGVFRVWTKMRANVAEEPGLGVGVCATSE